MYFLIFFFSFLHIKCAGVPEIDLVRYLKSCKRLGYRILGLEQTDNSVSLLKYANNEKDFPGKTVLVLGKENAGIPVEILREIDECIEIPQFGITRSLNVHVSAGIQRDFNPNLTQFNPKSQPSPCSLGANKAKRFKQEDQLLIYTA